MNIRKYSRYMILTLWAVALLHVVGCSAAQETRRGVTGDTKQIQNTTARSGSSAARSASSKSEPKGDQSQAVAKRDGSFDWQGKAFPTGDKRTSAILLEKGVPYEVMAGETFEYQMRITNISKNTLEAVEVTESIPSQMNVSGSEPRWASNSNGIATWNLGSLDAGETRTIQIMGSTTKTEAMSSCASVSFDSSVCAVIPVVKPAIQLTKRITEEALVCDTIVARYVVRNTGTGTARNLQITDQLPSNLVTQSGASVVRFEVPSLAAGKSREFQIELRAEKKGTFESNASVKGAGSLAAVSQKTTTVVHAPELKIVASGPKDAFLGQKVTYEWTVTNVGDGVAEDSIVEGTIPRGATFVSASAGGRRSGSKVLWSLGELRPAASRKVTAIFEGKEASTLQSQATAKAECASRVMASLQTRFVGIPAVLLEVVDVEDPVSVGDFETYTIRVTNQGTAPGTNIRIACALESNLEYVSATGATRGEIVGGKVNFAALRSLAPKGEAVWTVKVKAQKKGDTRFRVSLTSDQMERPVEETEATNIYQ